MKPNANFNKTVRKAAAIRLSALGDIALAAPALNALRQACPEAHIDFIVAEGFEGLVGKCPYIDRTLVYRRRRGLKGIPELLRFCMKLRAERYDLLVDFHDNRRSRIIASLAAPARKSISLGNKKDDYPQVVRYPKYLESVGIETPEPSIPFWVAEEEAEYLEGFQFEHGLSGKMLVGLGIVGSWPSKRWPTAHFAALGKRLAGELGAVILLLGGPGDTKEADAIAGELGGPCLNMAGKANISQSAALTTLCAALITNDSGLMHMSAASGVPTIGLFGATGTRLSAPVGEFSRVVRVDLDCSPCHKPECPLGTMECMKSLGPDQVFEAARETLIAAGKLSPAR